MAVTSRFEWVPFDEAVKRLGLTDRRELRRAVAEGRVRSRVRGRERLVAIEPERRADVEEPRDAASRPASPPGESGLSREEETLLSEPVSSPNGAPEARAQSHRGPPSSTARAIADLDVDMRRLRDRVENIAESIERLSTAREANGSAERFGEVCERLEDLTRTLASSSGEERLVVEATVIPPGHATNGGGDAAARRTDPFSDLKSRPTPAPDYGLDGQARARFARFLVALAIIAFSFLTGTLILAFV